ncbi:hypothetical protein ACFRKE_02160 [Kitasatospora indigofera]|uniref:hypothetical protein n=1 Tax=Kitasatospora indigofera TaxID=67307 RepID=UPI003635587E
MVTSIGADVSGSSRTTETPDRETGRMWIRTYRVDANGQPKGNQDSPAEFSPVNPAPLASGYWPPCACPQHRAA